MPRPLLQALAASLSALERAAAGPDPAALVLALEGYRLLYRPVLQKICAGVADAAAIRRIELVFEQSSRARWAGVSGV
jgi:hypothetical protein